MKKLSLMILLSILNSQNFPYFDGNLAYDYLKKQCELGPRFPGSEGHEKFIVMLDKFLNPIADKIIKHEIIINHPIWNKPVEITNILARFWPERERRILLLAHWDTREIADMDPILSNQNKPIMGANDGASGVAILLQIANILKNNPLLNIGVDLLFADGEDMGMSGTAESFGLGTKEFAKIYPEPMPYFGIGLDMVGDKNLEIEIERFSYYQAPQYVDQLWTLAKKLQINQFKHKLGKPIYDDHRVFYLETKIPTVDLIDFNYSKENQNLWHTLQDIPKNCSAESLEAVGKLVTAFLYIEDLK